MDFPTRLLVSCVIFYAVHYALQRLGLAKWPAFWLAFVLMIGVAFLRELAGGRL